MHETGLKCLLHVSAARGGSDYIVGRVGRLESSGEMLGASILIFDSSYSQESKMTPKNENCSL